MSVEGCAWGNGNCEPRSADGKSCAYRPPAVISQDEKDAEKAALRAVDARPIKKVAEAKARKRKRTQVGLPHVTPLMLRWECGGALQIEQ